MAGCDPHCRIGKVTLKTGAKRDNVYLWSGPLNPAAAQHWAPVPEVIEILSDLLDEARAGDLQAVAIATVGPAERTAHAWARAFGQNYHALSTSMADLEFAWRHDRHEFRAARQQSEPDGA